MAPVNASEIRHTGGRWVDYRLEGDGRKKPHGAFRYTEEEGGAVGQFKDRRIGETHTWASRAPKEYSAEEKAAYKEKMQRLRDEDAKRRAEEHQEAAELARATWKAASPALDHPYLRKKGVKAHGAKMNAEGDLILPRYDFSGKLWGLQTIDQAGEKKYQFSAKTTGTMFPITEKEEDRSVIFITEGFATGASIREATGRMVIIAYDAGNLLAVAQGARKKYPGAHIVVAADNDQFSFKAPRAEAVRDIKKEEIAGDDPRWAEWREAGYLFNTGVEKGKAAAHAINGAVIWPDFLPEDSKSKPTDFNDYHKVYGLKALDNKLSAALKKPELDDFLPIGEYTGNLIPDYEPRIDWMQLVVWKNEKTGEMHKDYSLNNAEVILTNKAPIGGCLVLDEFLNKKTIIRPLPWDNPQAFYARELENNDIVRLQCWLEKQGIKLGKAVVNDILEVVCANNPVNPAIEYLDSLIWDKTPRLDKWLAYYMGAEDQPHEYLARVGSCWLIAAAKRIYKPGTPFHHMLVLEGGQGAMKSTSLRTLATFGHDRPVAYFSDRITFEMIDRVDFAVHADGNVILEFQELSGMGKKDRNKIKQWITQDTDEFRKPYDPLTTKFPRKFVLAGTTNESQYLNDPTGDRRFWPVRVGKIDIEAIKKDKEQLWAEAVHRAKGGELWYIEPHDPVYKLMQNEQSVRYQGDPWDDIVGAHIERLNSVTVDEIFKEVLHLDKAKWDNFQRARIVNILTKAGFENRVVYDAYTKKSARKYVRASSPRQELFEEEIAID